MAVKKSALTRGVMGSEEANKRLDALDMRIEKCKRAFDMYFNGFEKRPPLIEYEKLKRDIRNLRNTGYSTATLRFKVQNMIARWQVMSALWDRQLQKMETGEFKPGVGAKAGRASETLRQRRGVADLRSKRRKP